MAQSVNKVILIGRLGKDPEMRYLDGGAAVCSFSLATSEGWNDKQGNRQEKTEWHNVSVWGKMAEVCAEHLGKGRLVYLEGRLQTREYEKDNVKRQSTSIVATSVQFLSPKGEGQPQAPKQPPQRQRPARGANMDQVSRDMGYRSAGDDDGMF